MSATRRTIGVLGGMGPWATLDFFARLLRLTPASRDQDHLRVLIDNNPAVPDRTAVLLGHGEDPTPWLVAGARGLAAAGADVLAIPCNTAHAFYPAIAGSVAIPVLHMMEEAAAAAAQAYPRLRRVGLLATAGTVRTGLYARAFGRYHVETIVPRGQEQAAADALIAAIKAGPGPGHRAAAVDLMQALAARGAEVIVLGCTELPLVLQADAAPVPVLDATEVLARRAVALARGDAAWPPVAGPVPLASGEALE
ncbi:MAG: amino acid racemase [Armatimonadota bacterium]|nr:amino acid racemase [Armatimonadota bacterium]